MKILILKKFYQENLSPKFIEGKKTSENKSVNSQVNIITPFNRYCSFPDALLLGWLRTKERTEIRIVNFCYQALHNKNFPEYLKLLLLSLLLCNSCGICKHYLVTEVKFTSKVTRYRK